MTIQAETVECTCVVNDEPDRHCAYCQGFGFVTVTYLPPPRSGRHWGWTVFSAAALCAVVFATAWLVLGFVK
jgi:hypothetical protein